MVFFNPDPKPPKREKKKNIRIKQKRFNIKYLYPADWGFNTESQMYKHIWDTRKHKSFLSGKYISQPMPWNFAHVLAKGLAFFPKYRLNDNNVILLTRQEHTLLDHGNSAQIAKYEKENNCNFQIIYDLYEKLKREYKQEYS
jgi:hypothetical protein